MEKQQDVNTSPLATEPVGRLLVRYAVPSVMSMLVMSLYNIVDQIFIGQSAAGYLGNAATTVAFPLVTVTLAISLLIGNGSAAFISLQMGRGNYDDAKRASGGAFTLILSVGILMMLVTTIFMRPILRAMGSTDTILPYAVEYVSVLAVGFPFVMAGTAMSNIIRADGSPRYSMLSTVSGAVLNTILDPIFIFTFNMGVRGAAIATVISQVISFFLVLYYLLRRARYTRLAPKYLKPKLSIVRLTLAYGSASFMTQIANAIVNLAMNNTLAYYGTSSIYGSDIPISAMGIVMKINGILISAIIGIAIGAQPILGFNYGAENYARVRRTYFTEISCTIILAGIFNLLFITVPGVFVGIFGGQSEMFTEFAKMSLSTYMSLVVFAGFQIPSSNYFQAVGKPLKAMTLSMSRQLLLLLPAILILPMLWGLEGVLYAAPVADCFSALITSFFIIREIRMLKSREKLLAEPAREPS